MNFKIILVFVVIATILSVSIVAAYENVDYSSNNGHDDSSHSKINYPARHSNYHTYNTHDSPKNDFTIDEFISSLQVI